MRRDLIYPKNATRTIIEPVTMPIPRVKIAFWNLGVGIDALKNAEFSNGKVAQ